MNYKTAQKNGWVGWINGKRIKPLNKERKPIMKHNTKHKPAMSLQQLAAMNSLPAASEQPFADHLEHLQALEQEATLLLLAHASLKQKGPAIGQLTIDDCTEDNDVDSTLKAVSAEQLMQDYKLCRQRNRKREAASKLAGIKLTFVELCQNYNLDDTERIYVQFLLLQATAPKFRKLLLECDLEDLHRRNNEDLTVGFLLELTCPSYREQLEAHRYFSVDGTLVREDLIDFDSNMTDGTNILTTRVTLQDSCIRYCLGDRNLYNATFKYIRRETGRIQIDQVVLPEQIKQEVVQRLVTFYKHRSSDHASQLDEFYGYGTGLAMLFHGPSGTGKTMLAQALSNYCQKPLFYMTEQSLDDMPGGYDDIFQTIFREANLHNGIVFFDEADDLFKEGSLMSRELLIAMEKSHCVTIMATNKPVDMDPAMERRLSLKVAFSKPDAAMRETIWQALMPDFVEQDESIDIKQLSEEFQFSGGLIKNTLVMAISNALQESNDTPRLKQEHIFTAAQLQLQQAMEHDPIFSTVNEQISLEKLSFSEKSRKEFKGLEKICNDAHQNSLPLRFVLHDKTGLGRDAAVALANKCELKARVINLSILMRKQASGNKVMDPVTQKEVEPLDVVFSSYCTEDALLIFNDPMQVASQIFKQDREGKSYMEPELEHRLNNFSGLCCFVTADELSGSASKLFDFSVSLGHPETTRQLAAWKEQLPKRVFDEDRLLSIIERHPMQQHEIETVVRRARYLSMLEGNHDVMEFCHLQTALNKYHQMDKSTVLFGGHHE